MRILVFGSLNIDRTYTVDAFVKPGQTISAHRMDEYCGGKGFNQAIALRRAGNEVCFAGAVGADGRILLDALERNGIEHHLVKQTDSATGHAVIQLDAQGANCIVILAGANGTITEADAEKALSEFGAGDLIVLQNEISCVPQIIENAHHKGMIVALNPSPYNARISHCNLSFVDYLLVNEEEGAALSGQANPDDMLDALHDRYPAMNIVLTLGNQGAMYESKTGQRSHCGIVPVEVVDTTAAGDTFTGYFLTEILCHREAERALRMASAAAAIAVSQRGAEPSIPIYADVLRIADTV